MNSSNCMRSTSRTNHYILKTDVLNSLHHTVNFVLGHTMHAHTPPCTVYTSGAHHMCQKKLIAMKAQYINMFDRLLTVVLTPTMKENLNSFVALSLVTSHSIMAYQRLKICLVLLPRNNRLTTHLGHKSIEAHNHRTAISF